MGCSEGMMGYRKLVIALVCCLASKGSVAADPSSYLAFDCFRTSDLSTFGVIPFDDCEVDLTTLDPWKGEIATGPGIWRFTFEGVVRFTSLSWGAIKLQINDTVKVRSIVTPGEGTIDGFFPISINALVQVEPYDTIRIIWEGEGDAVLFATDRETHWSGTYLGPGVPTAPMCQFDGQTYEFPGSCRLYWKCPNDGPIEIASCCPGAYAPSAQACIDEDEADVDAICAPLDICD